MTTITVRYLGTIRLLAHKHIERLDFSDDVIKLADVLLHLECSLSPELSRELFKQTIILSMNINQPGTVISSTERERILPSGCCITFVTPLTGG